MFWVTTLLLLLAPPLRAAADTEVGFTLEPPPGFMENVDAKERAAVLAQFGLENEDGSGGRRRRPHKAWIYARTPPTGPEALLLVFRIATTPRPAEDEHSAEGFRTLYEGLARAAGADVGKPTLLRLADGTPFWHALLEMEIEGRPAAMHMATLPRRDFELRILLRSDDPEGIASDWRAVVDGLRIDAPPPPPQPPTAPVDEKRFMRGLRNLAIIIALIVLYRWSRPRKTSSA